jgi:hypothetical protein
LELVAFHDLSDKENFFAVEFKALGILAYFCSLSNAKFSTRLENLCEGFKRGRERQARLKLAAEQ